MTENKTERSFEERQTELIEKFKDIGKMNPKEVEDKDVPGIDQQLVRGILVELGASLEVSDEAKKSLRKYKNRGKRFGLNIVWGEEKIDVFEEWVIKDFIPQYEKKVGKELRTLWDKGTQTFDDNKHSGMMQFLGELTAYGVGEMSPEEYKTRTRNRLYKGFKFEYGDPYEPHKPTKNSSIPPEFPQAALNYLASHKAV